jgi:hypothetical protein
VGRRRPRPLFSLPHQCPSICFHASCLTLSNRAHTHARVRDADAARGTAPPSRLRRPRLCPCRDCIAILLALTIVVEPPALTHANPTVALHTRAKPKHPDRDHLVSLFHLTVKDVLPTAWAHERQSKSVHVIVHTHARRRTPRCATAELAAVAKPPTCLCAQMRTWTLPLADQCSPPRTLLLCIQAKPRRDLARVVAFAPPLSNLTARPCPRWAALFRRRRWAHAHPHPRESSPALPVQMVHVHVHTHARPFKRAATPPWTPQSRHRGARAAPSRLPSRRRAHLGDSSHSRMLVHALDQAVTFALLARAR